MKIYKKALLLLLAFCCALVLCSCAPAELLAKQLKDALGSIGEALDGASFAPEHEHTVEIWHGAGGACEAGGEQRGKCIVCGDEIVKTAEPMGHTYRYGRCIRCGKEDDGSIFRFELNKSGDGYVLCDFSDHRFEDVVIPSEHRGLPVVEIKANAFLKNEVLRSITVPGSVKTIGSGAFSGCKNLCTVVLENGIETIGATAFLGCERLESVKIPETVSAIPYDAFAECSSLVSVELHDGVKTIGEGAFRACAIESISLPAKLAELGNHAFYYCDLKCEIVIPETLESIGSYAFANTHITGVTFSERLKFIDEYAFAYTDIRTVKLGAATELNNGVFKACRYLESIEACRINYNIGIFEDCTTLVSAAVLQGTEELGKACFLNCWSMEQIYIPESVDIIGENTFEHCENLKTIRYGGTMEQWQEIYKYPDWDKITGTYTVECSDGVLEK